jgi:hypothetical protein
MIFPDKRIAAPYLRRGLIRAQKTGNPLELLELSEKAHRS